MNDNQKERLLKIAESNPELAKEMIDIFKDDKKQSNEPIAVKMVKAEEDKIEITAEQKKWAVGYIATLIFLFALIAGFVTSVLVVPHVTNIDHRQIGAFMPIVFLLGALGIFLSWYCAYKSGMPTVKSFLSRHFKWS
ncbi:hypothetical protein [Cysteiniphilum marinum]|uniref:hypothetical protein n=1 Tax=Cysteiniphilum marinum TaxID=2774191 RepID=UPI00193B83EE|nr:hypothetical protein [Cysteiniphilum marinum]